MTFSAAPLSTCLPLQRLKNPLLRCFIAVRSWWHRYNIAVWRLQGLENPQSWLLDFAAGQLLEKNKVAQIAAAIIAALRHLLECLQQKQELALTLKRLSGKVARPLSSYALQKSLWQRWSACLYLGAKRVGVLTYFAIKALRQTFVLSMQLADLVQCFSFLPAGESKEKEREQRVHYIASHLFFIKKQIPLMKTTLKKGAAQLDTFLRYAHSPLVLSQFVPTLLRCLKPLEELQAQLAQLKARPAKGKADFAGADL